jgi:hypothetical protein
MGNGPQKWSVKMEKLFSVAGTSALEGVVKFRVANGSAAARTKVLVRSGHTDIKLVDLAKPMSKEDAIAFVKSQGSAFSAETATATKPAKVAKAPKQKTVKLSTIVKKVSKKFVAEKSVRAINASFAAKTKEVPAEQLLAEVGIQPTANSINEIAKIKAKNLETMRRVSNKLAALRNYN